MKSDFYHQLTHSNAHRSSRDSNCQAAMQDQKNLAELFAIAFDLKDNIHFKACWALELVLEKNLTLLLPYIEEFCNILSRYENDSAIRSVSKICLFLAQSKTIILTLQQEEKITETCLDWLIQDER